MSAGNEAELADMVASARGPLAIRGGGTRGIELKGEVLDTTGLTGVDFYEPGALTLVVSAGTTLREIDAVLSAENQRLAFEPMDHRRLMGTEGEPTIGGVVAGNISGPRRIQAGACRDFLLGVRYIDGTGQVIKNGGRVMKNVTGYDLVRLMAGSWGTLGVLSQVSLKVLPRSETQATLLVRGCDAGTAVAAMSAALGSPFEVSGAAFDPDAGGAVMVRVEGFAESVRYRTGRLADLLGGFGDIESCDDAEASDRLWTGVRDVEKFAGKPGDVWRLSVRPSDAPALAERIGAEDLLFDWGGGLIWARVPEATDLRARIGPVGGHATLVRAGPGGADRLDRFHPQAAPLEAISAGLRARFDPRGIFNRGLMEPLQPVGV
ncbi:glycolate oxidase subunit GlcE [Sedimentitalea sp. JM2-8]|uniref:Glycolate oxidase subunit GlcE n=1 Tax=Sedimentitalea xiamensis TaxID=3050037 RepID=A0ABT7FJC1_9RHOB|nr:glycolate oxidase subunit GlcE [Sedimentitalea xiamensis]MDK3075192.1 glycolate oxidase subunit GlcE [Sedimentitalea xiamensis]